MAKHTIEIEGLPEEWEPVAFRIGNPKEHIIDCGEVLLLDSVTKFPCLIIKKKQPRRIVLEESDYDVSVKYDGRYWRIVKESDLSLNNEEPKLSLSVDECRKLYQYMDNSVLIKLREFLKDK